MRNQYNNGIIYKTVKMLYDQVQIQKQVGNYDKVSWAG